MRDPVLQRFIDLTEEAITAKAVVASSISQASTRIFNALRQHQGEAWVLDREKVPVLELLPSAFALASQGPAARLAAGLAALEPRLAWYRRGSAETLGAAFHDGHANAYIVGPQGIERRDDAWIGVSLLAPNQRYPDHDHAPEEIYVSLAGGAWWNSEMDWTEPGAGGLVYNPPGIQHAMRTGEEPLLAIWCLWAGT